MVSCCALCSFANPRYEITSQQTQHLTINSISSPAMARSKPTPSAHELGHGCPLTRPGPSDTDTHQVLKHTSIASEAGMFVHNDDEGKLQRWEYVHECRFDLRNESVFLLAELTTTLAPQMMLVAGHATACGNTSRSNGEPISGRGCAASVWGSLTYRYTCCL